MTARDAANRHEMATAAHAAMCALQFAADPAMWPAFAAWAEQKVPGETWGEADRLRLAEAAVTMGKLAQALDG